MKFVSMFLFEFDLSVVCCFAGFCFMLCVDEVCLEVFVWIWFYCRLLFCWFCFMLWVDEVCLEVFVWIWFWCRLLFCWFCFIVCIVLFWWTSYGCCFYWLVISFSVLDFYLCFALSYYFLIKMSYCAHFLMVKPQLIRYTCTINMLYNTKIFFNICLKMFPVVSA